MHIARATGLRCLGAVPLIGIFFFFRTLILQKTLCHTTITKDASLHDALKYEFEPLL